MKILQSRDKIFLSSLCLLGALLVVQGCGGGGDGDDDNDLSDLSGEWNGALVRIQDSCGPSTAPATLAIRHVVVQNEDAVELVSQDGVRYLGNSVGENGFSVDATVPGEAGCSEARRVEYDSINNDGDSTADVVYRRTTTCSAGQGTCQREYSGTATRSRAGQRTPIPGDALTPIAPLPTGSPGVSPDQGCRGMTSNPAAGTYSGDGGCGISDVRFSFGNVGANQTVVLEPFGANSVTSFTIDSNNPNVATAARTDLEIRGEAGYSCQMVCAPPGSFRVSCVKEGVGSCVEKF